MTTTPAQLKILTAIDPTTLSLDGLLVHYNELVEATGQGEKRNAKFRDKPTGIKAVKGLLVQIAATQDVPEDGPGRTRLRASGQAEALREATLADQRRERAKVLPSPPPHTTPQPPVADTPPVASGARIRLLVEGNPKKGTTARKRFALYIDGMTVADYYRAVGEAPGKIRISHDVASGYIKLTT